MSLASSGSPPPVLPLCRAAGVPLIINDHPRVAAAVGADGVHLGQDDGITRRRSARSSGRGLIVGRSTHSLEQARAARGRGLRLHRLRPAVSPPPPSPADPAIGLADIAAVEREVGARIPVFCIGGIKPGNLDRGARRRRPPGGDRLRPAPGPRRRAGDAPMEGRRPRRPWLLHLKSRPAWTRALRLRPDGGTPSPASVTPPPEITTRGDAGPPPPARRRDAVPGVRGSTT